MKIKLTPIAVLVASLSLVACSSKPTANNYNDYMNAPTLKSGATGSVDSQIVNKPGWNKIEATQISLVRTFPDGSYATDPSQGVLTVRATLVNTGNSPVQGNWRCNFFDSNHMKLYEAESNQVATTDTGLGWHRMIVYPLQSKNQTYDANVINCKASDSLATNYRVEFHDTANDITVYKR
jgi:hypothetical protein